MNLKTSFINKFFSKAVIKSDIKRYWWASAVLMVMHLLFIFSMILYEHKYSGDFSDFLWHTDRGAFSYCAAFILAGLLFSYLHRSPSVSFMHGIPVTRTQQYFSHIISGFVIIIIPVLPITLLAAFKSPFAPEYFCLTATVSLLFFSVVTMVSTAVGNRFAAMVFSVGLMLLPAYIEILKRAFLEEAIRGYVPSPSIFNYLYISPEKVPVNCNFLIYIILSIDCFIIGFIMYKYRNLEKSGEIVVFDWLRPIFMVISIFCFSSFAYIISFGNVIISFIAGIVTLGASYMLIQKSISLKGSRKYLTAYIVIFIFIIIAIKFDLLGYVKNIPDIDNIKSASFYNEVYYDSGFLLGENYKDRSELNDDEKQLLLDFHKDIANMSDEEYSKHNFFINTSFEYELKLGGKLQRNYYVSYNTVKRHRDLFNTWAFVQYTYPFLNPHNKITSISLYNNSITLSWKETADFIEAFSDDLKDHIENNTFIDTIDRNENEKGFTEFYINYAYNVNTSKIGFCRITVTDDYPKTIKYINDLLGNIFITNNITDITVSNDINTDEFTFDKDKYPELMHTMLMDIRSFTPYYSMSDRLTNDVKIIETVQSDSSSNRSANSAYKLRVTLDDLSNSQTADKNKQYEFYIPEDYKNTINYITKSLEFHKFDFSEVPVN